ncbi:MAG: type I DNA topoisomerase [Peptoniphilus sp.]|nr:type I DNA topoisomerase [Peptoniphilus sp.]MDD7363858.1 type I DNA topoisomerase [Bacillota bacterium]MDY6044303.1 type I DNA topoisomerase [Peptoniphilus sp.]
MSRNLIIVESPTKAKTIRKMAGSHYKVVATVGHVRDLPKSKLGIDTENNYEPKYINIRGKGPIIKDLKKEAKKAGKVLLATDPDREGEAISWHLTHILDMDPNENVRISFNEITKDAVKKGIKNPRPIDMELVDAQQARRILDRLVGYKISPLLWKKVKSGLSAGRVQSVVLKIICDREEQIGEFEPSEYWTIMAKVLKNRRFLEAKYAGILEGDRIKSVELDSKEAADAVLKRLDKEYFTVHDVQKGSRKRRTLAPFTTSTMQQEANKRLNFSTRRTMQVAQRLYEGITIPGEGSVGLITYMRTDSTRISAQVVEKTKDYILSNYGKEYSNPSTWSKKKENTQDAHECIRPADVTRTPYELKDSLGRDEYRLYQLIWSRFVASQMTAAVYATQKVKLLSKKEVFQLNGNTLTFDGFLRVLPSKDQKDKEIPALEKGEKLKVKDILPEQHFTQPPARYNEASLIKLLEELGIGRPSTYAPIINTLLARYYVVMEEKRFVPTELGETVNGLLTEYFPMFVDEDFTAKMEHSLDAVAEGDIKWQDAVDPVYKQLMVYLEQAEKEIEKVEIRDEPTDVVCEKCGRNMVIKMGRYGKFLACPGFPECRNTKPLVEKIGVKCPKCDEGEIVVKRSKKGRKFYGCDRYPDCDFVSWDRPIDETCPKCGSILTERDTRKGKRIKCHNQECDYVKWEKSDDGEK